MVKIGFASTCTQRPHNFCTVACLEDDAELRREICGNLPGQNIPGVEAEVLVVQLLKPEFNTPIEPVVRPGHL